VKTKICESPLRKEERRMQLVFWFVQKTAKVVSSLVKDMTLEKEGNLPRTHPIKEARKYTRPERT